MIYSFHANLKHLKINRCTQLGAWSSGTGSGGSRGIQTGLDEAPFYPTLIYQFKLKYIYQIQISAIDSNNVNCNDCYPPQFYYPGSILALAKASAREDEAQLIISRAF